MGGMLRPELVYCPVPKQKNKTKYDGTYFLPAACAGGGHLLGMYDPELVYGPGRMLDPTTTTRPSPEMSEDCQTNWDL